MASAIQMLRMRRAAPAVVVPTFNHVPGQYTAEAIDLVTFSITCSEAAVWTWTRTSTTRNSATPATGGSGTTWTGTCQSIAATSHIPQTQSNDVVYTVNATVRGVTYGPWSVDLICDGGT